MEIIGGGAQAPPQSPPPPPPASDGLGYDTVEVENRILIKPPATQAISTGH
jgi:hypothetical protein